MVTALGRLVHAELTKLRTTAFPWLLLGLVVVWVGLDSLSRLAAPGLDYTSTDEIRTVLAAGAGAAPLALVLGALMVTGEHRHGTITSALLVEPVRRRLLASKLLIGAGAGVALAVVSVFVMLAAAWPWLAGEATGGGWADVGRAVSGAAAALALWGAIGVGVGALVRNQVAALVGALVWLFVFEPSLAALAPGVSGFLPTAAGQALAGSTADHLLPLWAGALVLAGWTVVLGSAGAARFVHADIS